MIRKIVPRAKDNCQRCPRKENRRTPMPTIEERLAALEKENAEMKARERQRVET
jgi:hypothetical protein